MTTNTDIMTSLFGTIANSAISQPKAWPGADFTPPASGEWLEVYYQPNDPQQPGIANDASILPRGIFRVLCMTRPSPTAAFGTQALAEQVAALYPKGATVSGNVRISRHPYTSTSQFAPDRMGVSVIIEYSA